MRPFARTLRSLPAFLAYGQFGLVAIVDCMLVGPLGTTPLAAVGFAGNVLAPFFIFPTAVALALAPFVAGEDHAAGRAGAARRLLQCLRAQGAVVLACVAILLALGARLELFHQPAEVTRQALPYYRGMLFALPSVVAFASLREYAVALGRSTAPAAFAALAIAAKLALSAALIHGAGLGVAGAAVGTAVAFGATTALFALYLARATRPAGVAKALAELLREPVFRNDLFAQGLPVALQQLFELGAFYFAGIMAGWLGTEALAAHNIGLNVANGAALLSLAIAQTTAAEVARGVREGRPGGGRAAWTGAATAVAVMAVVGSVVVLARGALFAAAPDCATLALLVGPSLLIDGAQLTLGGVLRGLLDAKFFSVATLACWWCFCLPLAYVLAFVLGLGIVGLWAALCATLLLIAAVLAVRVARHARPAIAVANPAIAHE